MLIGLWRLLESDLSRVPSQTCQGLGARFTAGLAMQGAKVIVADVLDGNIVVRHDQLIEKIKAKDTHSGRVLMKRHVQRSKDHIIHLLQMDEELNRALYERV